MLIVHTSCNKQGFQQFINKSKKNRHQCIFNVISTSILAFIERYSFQTNWYIEECIYMIEYNIKNYFGSYLDIKSLILTWLFLSYLKFIASEIKSLSITTFKNVTDYVLPAGQKFSLQREIKGGQIMIFLKPPLYYFKCIWKWETINAKLNKSYNANKV